MVFSSVPVFQLDPANWQHPPGGSVSDNINNDNFTPLPMPPPLQGLSIQYNSMVERPRLELPQQETAHKCPRCASTNTKFCYYNNYSLSQPRHFCKSCRRYWTKGGALRNVPVGGGFRRNKRSKITRSKSPVTSNTSTSGVSTSSCTTNNIILGRHVVPSVLPHLPNLFPSINVISDLGTNQDINSLSFREIQPPTATTTGEYSDQWGMQELSFLAGLELPPSAAGMYQFRSEGVGEVTSTFETVDSCGPSLVKFEENQGFMSLSKNFLGFPENEHQQYWSNGNAWIDGMNKMV